MSALFLVFRSQLRGLAPLLLPHGDVSITLRRGAYRGV